MTASVLSQGTKPAFRSVPPDAGTLGPEVAGLNASVGFAPDADQEMILGDIFAVDARGRSAAFEIAVIACRQNIKTSVFEQAVLGWLFVTGERLIVWSAHEWDTIKEAFRDFDELITGSDALRRRVKHVYRGNGDEAIELLSGSRLIFKTRTKGGGRGLTGDKVILDEGFALRPMHMGALLPALSARPDPQVLYGSSAGLAESSVLRAIRDRGRAGGDPRLAYTEYCAPPPARLCMAGDGCTHALNASGCGCDDPANWSYGNPARGRRITDENIAAERRAMPPAEFGRERMGWWDDPAEGFSPLGYARWALLADPSSQPSGPVAFGFEISPDLSSAAVAVAGRRADGLGHWEVTDHRPGSGWLVPRLAELADRHEPCAVALNASGQSRAVITELAEHGFEAVHGGKQPGPGKRRLVVLGSRDWSQACGALVRDVIDGTGRHLGQAPLDVAVEGARSRPLEESWAWSQKNSAADICPLAAVTAARHAFAVYGTGDARTPFALWG